MSNDPSRFEFDDSDHASEELSFENLEGDASDFPSDFDDQDDAEALDVSVDAEPAQEVDEDELADDAAGEGAEHDAGEASSQPEDSDEQDQDLDEPKRRSWLAVANWDLYTIMLGISLLAVTIACLLLYLELQQYSPFPWWKTSGVVEGM